MPLFSPRLTVAQVEEGHALAPKFDAAGLIPVVTTDAATGEVLMMGVMNAEALTRSIATGEAHYWSRSRQRLWHKGVTSGLIQKIVEMRIDDDQDAIWLRVQVAGAQAAMSLSLLLLSRGAAGRGRCARAALHRVRKLFDPAEVYGDAPNPTQL